MLQVIYGGTEKKSQTGLQPLQVNESKAISSTVAADFDGDLITDLLYLTINDDDSRVLKVCYGRQQGITYSSCSSPSKDLLLDPFIFE